MSKLKNRELAYAIAIISDVADYFGAAVPIAGDVVDLITIPLLYVVTKEPLMVLGVAEFVPVVDVLPTYTAIVFAVDRGYLK